MSEGADRKREPRTGLVTSASVQARDVNRMSVFVEGKFSFGMPLEAGIALGIRKGIILDDDLLARCLAEDESYRARKKALNLLAFQQRSTGELEDRLRRAGFSASAREAALARMQKLGYLDDEAFAMSFARERLGGRGHGRRRVLLELGRKGIPTSLAERVVNDVAEDRDEVDDALTIARKRAHALRRLDDPRKKRDRLWAHLLRRGFESDVIRAALDRLKSEVDGDVGGTEDPPTP